MPRFFRHAELVKHSAGYAVPVGQKREEKMLCPNEGVIPASSFGFRRSPRALDSRRGGQVHPVRRSPAL
jgi:hypothetical protein